MSELAQGEPHSENLYIPGSTRIGTTDAGDIYSYDVPFRQGRVGDLPQKVDQLLSEGHAEAERYQRGLSLKLNRNSPNPYQMIGKPSSAFIVRPGRLKFKMQYLVEDPDHKRDPRKTLHSYIVENDEEGSNSFHPANIFGRTGLWSGHVAKLTPEYASAHYRYVYLLDSFSNPPKGVKQHDRVLLNLLHANGFIPVAAHGQIIPRP